MIDNTDGNLAALREYEKRCEAQDIAWECTLSNIQSRLSEISELVESCRAEAEEMGYDFTESIEEAIQDAIT